MNTKELKIYNEIIKCLMDLTIEGQEKRQDLLCYLLTWIFTDGKITEEEINRRFNFLVESSNKIANVLENISREVERHYEQDDHTILESTIEDMESIGTLYGMQEDYTIVLMDYEEKINFSLNKDSTRDNIIIAKVYEKDIENDIKKLIKKNKKLKNEQK